MRDDLLTVTVNRKSLDDWKAGISRNFRNALTESEHIIEREWSYELERQSSENESDGWWHELEQLEYEPRKNRKWPANVGNILQASGDLFAAYKSGIRSNISNAVVGCTINLPDTDGPKGEKLRLIAEVHEGRRGLPKGLEPRPFNTEPFFEIALAEFNRAMTKATE